MKQRYDTLDIMKGLAIVFVIFDHSGNALHPIIDHIEVPIFFVISGFLFKSGAGFKQFAVKKFYSLVVPYLFFCLLYAIPYFFSIGGTDGETGARGIISHAVNILIVPANYPLWFIKALVVGIFLYYLIDKLAYRLNVMAELIINVALAIGITAICQLWAIPERLLITGIPQGLQALPLIGFGHCAARIVAAKPNVLSIRNAAVICTVSTAGAILTGIEGVHLHEACMGERAWLFYPCVLFSAIAFAGVCRVIVKARAIKYIGENSISFFGFHAIAILIVLTLVDMPPVLLPLAVICLCIPAVELYRRYIAKKLH